MLEAVQKFAINEPENDAFTGHAYCVEFVSPNTEARDGYNDN